MQKVPHQFTLMFPSQIRATRVCFVSCDFTFLSHPYLLSSTLNTLPIRDTGDVRIKRSHNYSFALGHTFNCQDNNIHTTITNCEYWKQLKMFLHMPPFSLSMVLFYCSSTIHMANIWPIHLQISMCIMLTTVHLLMSFYYFGHLSSFFSRFLRKESWGQSIFWLLHVDDSLYHFYTLCIQKLVYFYIKSLTNIFSSWVS